MFGAMVDYWAYTGDETYVNATFQAMQHQVGDDLDFMPLNQTKSEGNDEYVHTVESPVVSYPCCGDFQDHKADLTTAKASGRSPPWQPPSRTF